MNERKRLIRITAVSLAAFSALWSLVFLALRGISVPCVFYKLTGLLCPGCGNSRAAISLICGEWSTAFRYNMMFLPEMVYIAWVYFVCAYRYVKGRGFSYYAPPFPILDILFLVAFVLWGILRNVF